jgi:RNA:NAD 2'-phosphotransferase (TPT1/KptA family)
LPASVRMLYHGTSEATWRKILGDPRGLIPGGNGSGRTESYFSSRAPWEAGVACDSDVPGYRFSSDATIVYDRGRAELKGVKFKLAISDAILTRSSVPNLFLQPWPWCATMIRNCSGR